MKTPASIVGISGRFIAMLWLAGSVHGATNSPPASAPVAIPISPLQAVATDANTQGENAPLPSQPSLTPWTREIVKMAQSGVDEGVMIAFVQNSGTFGLGADQIIYLRDIGISDQTIYAMLQHDREVVSGERPFTIVSEPTYEPLFGAKSVPGSKSPNELANQPAAPPVSSPAAAAVSASTSGQKTVSAPNPPVAESPAITQSLVGSQSLETAGASTAYWQEPPSPKKQPLYPVREPYPVELLPPIVFVRTAEVVPNTLIVYGFPKP
jgi:hypothetical protein